MQRGKVGQLTQPRAHGCVDNDRPGVGRSAVDDAMADGIRRRPAAQRVGHRGVRCQVHALDELVLGEQTQFQAGRSGIDDQYAHQQAPVLLTTRRL